MPFPSEVATNVTVLNPGEEIFFFTFFWKLLSASNARSSEVQLPS